MIHAKRLLAAMTFCTCSTLLLVGSVAAEVKLPSIFGDHMVLQRGKPVSVWGQAEPGESIKVSIADKQASGKANSDGKWKVALPELKAGGPHELAIEGSSGASVTFEDVLIGEVWICSGQSNMAMTVSRSADSEQEIAAANHPSIRLITVRRIATDAPQEDFNGNWAACSPQAVGNFSAVGYFFGRRIQEELNVPIGLVNSSVGGTPAESWTSRSALEAQSSLKPLLDRWEKAATSFDPEKAKGEFEEKLARWQETVEKRKAEGKKPPRRRPRLAVQPRLSTHYPGMLFNGKIAPLIPFAICGAIWYQGESNAPRAYQYRTVFPTMIRDWRKRWAQGDFPFIFVQLANYRAVNDEPVESNWAELREAQSMTLRSVDNTGQAVIIDIGEANDIHPKNKQDVGKRLALWALANTYEKQIPDSGPVLASISIFPGKVEVRFSHTDGGLVAKGGVDLKGFAVAGSDRRFVWAKAKIVDNVVHVWHEDVKNPIAVRYGWADNPVCNLYNGADLPASPFRTDEWPGITDEAF